MGVKRIAGRALPWIAAGLVAAALVDGVRLVRAQQFRTIISEHRAHELGEDGRPEVLFARALELAATGDVQGALAAYRRVAIAPGALAAEALYNSGNILLRQALALRSGGDEAQATTLFELAKRNYRDVLRADPGHWDAKYNLERTLRAAPDSDEPDVAALPPPPARERAVTTMRGFSLGLP